MSGAELISFVRFLLRDTGAGKATTQRMHQDSEILAMLVTARQEILRALLANRRSENIALTISRNLRMISTASPVPADFVALECGLSVSSNFGATGTYVQAEFAPIGVAMDGSNPQQIYIGAGIFKGTASGAVYWAAHSTPIANDGTVLTDAADNFYYTCAFFTARELIAAERGGADTRWTFFNMAYQRRLAALK